HRHELERLPAVEAGGAGDALGGGLLPLPEDVAEDARAVGGAAGGRPAGGAAEEAAEQPPQAPAPAEEAVEEAAVVVAFEGLVERLRALGRARVALHLPEQEREGGRRGRPRLLLVGADGAADLLEGRALEDRAEEAGEVCHEERGLGGARLTNARPRDTLPARALRRGRGRARRARGRRRRRRGGRPA